MQSTDITIGPNVGFLAVLNLLGAAQGVLLALALLTTKAGHRTANRLLAALTLTISIAVSGAVLITSNYVFAFPHLSRLHQPIVFLAAPLLFLYIRELTAREQKFQKRDFLHFIPFVLCFVYLLPYYLQSGAQKIQILLSEFLQESFGPWYYFRSALLIAQVLVYLILIGGRVYEASRDLRYLQDAFSQIADELGRQYSIGYYPKKKGDPGERRQIKVHVSRPGVAVRARDKYVYQGPAKPDPKTAIREENKQTQSAPVPQKKPFVGDLKTPQ